MRAMSRWRPRIAAVAVAFELAAMCAGPAAFAGPSTKVADAPYPAEFRTRVKASITKAIEHLRTRQIDDAPAAPQRTKSRLDPAISKRLDEETAFEEAAAVTWALRRAGVAADDPTFAKARKIIAARAPRTPEEAALLLLGLCTEALPSGDPFSIEAGAVAEAKPRALAAGDKPLVDRAVRFLVDQQIRSSALGDEEVGGWDPCLPGADDPKFKTGFVEDTYMALLGLEAASRSGASVPSGLHLAALKFLVGRQAAKGSAVTLKMNEVRGKERAEWTESAKARGFSSVGAEGESEGYATASGAVGLAICQDALQKDKAFTAALRQQSRLALRDAIAWIQAHYDIARNPTVGGSGKVDEGSLFHQHWLQSLARLEIHARMRLIGGHDWYAEGAEVLLKTQTEDGSWEPIWWSNCYSVLFLMRASLTSITPVVTEPR